MSSVHSSHSSRELCSSPFDAELDSDEERIERKAEKSIDCKQRIYNDLFCPLHQLQQFSDEEPQSDGLPDLDTDYKPLVPYSKLRKRKKGRLKSPQPDEEIVITDSYTEAHYSRLQRNPMLLPLLSKLAKGRHFTDILNSPCAVDSSGFSSSDESIVSNTDVTYQADARGVLRRRSRTCSTEETNYCDHNKCRRSLARNRRWPCLRSIPSETLIQAPQGCSNPLTEPMLNSIEACFEEGQSCHSLSSRLILDLVSLQFHAPSSIITHLIHHIVLKEESSSVIDSVHHAVCRLRGLHPLAADLQWAHVVSIMEGLAPKCQTCVVSLKRNAIALEHIVSILETDLLQHRLGAVKQVKRTLAYQLLIGVTEGPSRVKQVIQWLDHALVLDHKICVMNREEDCAVPQVLPLVQRLLDLVMTCHSAPAQQAELISHELGMHFMHNSAQSMVHLRLLETMVSPLLKLYTIKSILQTYCTGVTPSTVDSLQSLVRSYFHCHPPHNLTTPPTTPVYEADGGETTTRYSPDKCEELVFLLTSLLESYIIVHTEGLTESLSERYRGDQKKKLSGEDITSLGELDIERISEKIDDWCSKPTVRTTTYLARLEVLQDLAKYH